MFFFLVLCLFSLPLIKENNSQEQKREQIAPPTYEVEVIVTNVDVVVTDKEGKAVTGLKPENFEIYEDNLLQKTTNFYEVKGMEIYAGSTDSEKKKLSVSSKPLPDKSPKFGNKIIMYFDNWQLHPLNRNWSIKKLENFVNSTFSLEKADRLGMIVCLDQKLTVIQDFTSNPRLLLQALAEVKTHSGQSLLRLKAREDMQKELNRIFSESTRYDKYESFEKAMGYARNYVESEQNDLNYSLKSLKAFLEHLEGIEGRKILIYVSDGLPLNPSEEVFSYVDQAFPLGNARTETMNYDAAEAFNDLTIRCNANEIALYPINAQGLESQILSADKEAGWNIFSRGSGMVKSGSRERNAALKLMAQDTGGFPILNTNDIESGLTKLENDLQFYYSLGYKSLHREDGRYHSLQVKLVGVSEDYTLRVRRGYLRISQEGKIREGVLARLYLKRQYNPMHILVQIIPVETMAVSRKRRLTIKFLTPIKNLALFPEKEVYLGQLKFYIALLDAEGRVSPCHELVEQIKIPSSDYEIALQKSYPYYAEMYVDPGHYSISLAVRDIPGDAVNYLQLETQVQ